MDNNLWLNDWKEAIIILGMQDDITMEILSLRQKYIHDGMASYTRSAVRYKHKWLE